MKAGWEIKKLGEVCEILDSLRKPVTKKDRREGCYPYYGASGIQDYVDSYIFDGRYLLVGEDGAKWGTNDRSAFIIEGKCWVNNHAHILKVHDNVVDTFLEYYLVFSDLDKYITGAIVPKLTQQALRNIPIPIPPLLEQERIVSELDLISGVIDKKKQQLKELDSLAQSIFYEMFGNPVENDKGWDVRKLGEVCVIERGGSPRPISAYITNSDDGVNWIKIGDAVEGSRFINHTAEKIKPEGVKKSRFVYKGDFILSNSMSFGKPYILGVDGCIHDGWLVLRDNNGVFDKSYLYYYLSSDDLYNEFAKLAVGGVVNNLNSQLVRGVNVCIPPLSLQQEFASKIEKIERQKELIKQSLQETETLFNSRMDFYFN